MNPPAAFESWVGRAKKVTVVSFAKKLVVNKSGIYSVVKPSAAGYFDNVNADTF